MLRFHHICNSCFQEPFGGIQFLKGWSERKRLNYIHCRFNINILLFGPFKIGKLSLVYIAVLLTTICQIVKKAEYVGNIFHESLLEDNGKLLAFHQLTAAVLQSLLGLGFEKKQGISEVWEGEKEKSHLHCKVIIINLKLRLLRCSTALDISLSKSGFIILSTLFNLLAYFQSYKTKCFE